MGGNYRLLLAYDGTGYLGWQKTKMGPNIEGTLQDVLEKILQHPTPLQAASRTDTGVHAEGQVVQFKSSKDFDVNTLRYSCNALLPPDIVVREILSAPEAFHPTLDAEGKIYRYTLSLGPYQLPFERWTAWHVPASLERDVLEAACRACLGTHDFTAFTNQRKDLRYPHRIRTLRRFTWEETPSGGCFHLEGDHFLYKMARNLVGSVIDCARGKLPLLRINEVLVSGDRKAAGVTAPAHGLTLEQVLYPSEKIESPTPL